MSDYSCDAMAFGTHINRFHSIDFVLFTDLTIKPGHNPVPKSQVQWGLAKNVHCQSLTIHADDSDGLIADGIIPKELGTYQVFARPLADHFMLNCKQNAVPTQPAQNDGWPSSKKAARIWHS